MPVALGGQPDPVTAPEQLIVLVPVDLWGGRSPDLDLQEQPAPHGNRPGLQPPQEDGRHEFLPHHQVGRALGRAGLVLQVTRVLTSMAVLYLQIDRENQ